MTTFPQAPLGVKAELDLAGTWTDISSYVLQRDGTSPPISVTRGRPDESAQAVPGTAAMQWNNRDGRFSARNPTGAYYGKLGRNTPLRLSVPAQTTYLRLETDQNSAAACPDAAGLHITGDIDIRIDVDLSGITETVLASKWNTVAANGFSWIFVIGGDCRLLLFWSTTGADQKSAESTLPVTMGRQCFRVTLQVNNGASGNTATFYTGAAGGADGSTWTQLGDPVIQAGTTSIHSTTAAQVAVGNYDPANAVSAGITGSVREFELRSGIAGTVEAHPVFSAQTAGATSFADAQSNTWTLSGTAELSARSYRFHGETSSLPVAWETSGSDVWVPVAAGGLLRRLGQGSAPLDSSMKRAILSQTGTLAPHAYWPCEDLQGSTAIGSAIGGPLMTLIGGTGDGSVTTTGPAFAADSSFLCSAALPTLNDSAWIGQVPAYTSNGSIIVRFLMKVSAAPPNGAWIVRVIMTGTCQQVIVYYGTGGQLGVAGYNASGNVFDSGAGAFGVDNEQVWVSMELRPAGGTVDWSLATLQPGSTSALTTSGTFAGTIGNVTEVYADPGRNIPSVTIGHITVQSDWESLFNLYQPFSAWQGEVAGHRFTRLCSENGITSRIYGPGDTTVPMGAQAPATLTSLLQEVEDADHGQIFEPRQILGLGYRPQAALLNQAAAVTIDYSAAEFGGGNLQPTYDDQFTRNDITVQRASGNISGASYRYELDDGSAMSTDAPPGGVGDYSTSASVNVQTDDQLPDQAGWLVHLGTVDEARWPSLPVNMARTAVSGIFYAVLEAELGDFADVANPPTWLPPDDVKQLIYGTKEDFGGYHFQISWNGVPESPHETGIYDDVVQGRADTDGSTLHANASSGATSITVDTTTATSPLWSTAAADCPFDIGIGGEQITVTAVSGSSSPQTFTVTRSVNGVVKAHSAGDDVRLWTPPIYAML